MCSALAARSSARWLARSRRGWLAGWLAGCRRVWAASSSCGWIRLASSCASVVARARGASRSLAFELDLTSRISVQGFFCWCPFCGFLFPDVLAGIFGDWSFRRSWSWLTNLQALLIIVTLLWLAFWGTSPWNTTPPIGKIDKRMSPCLGFCG